MATSGSFDTNHRVSGKYNTYATFSWWQTGQSIDGNYTDISWSLTGKTASQHQNIYVYNVSVTVNGATTSKNFNGSMYDGTTLLTGTARIYHNNDGTKNFSASAGLAMYSSGSWYSGSGSWNLDSIPRKATIKSAPNFNDEENPTITYENKAGNSVNSLQACVSLDGSKDDIAYRDISKTGTSYKFNLTEAERNVLRNATKTSNSRTVTFFVRTIIGGNTFYDTVDKTFSIVNANPVFSNYAFHDGNSTTTAITGNNQWIIQNKSSLVVDITSANKATAKKSATMASYVYEISSYSGSANYTTSDLSKTIGAINASQNQNLKVTAIDSRNNSTAVSKTVNIVPYATPVLNVSATRQNNFEANTTIKVSGSASLLKVNNVVKNTVNATSGVQYRKKKSSTTTWESWTNIPSSYNTSTGAVTVSDFVISLDNQQAWDFEFKLTDRLETKTVSISVSQGQPQFFIGADGRVGVGGMPTKSKSTGESGLLEVKGRYYGTEGEFSMNDAVNPDTPSGWASKYGNGRRFTFYKTAGKFENQPSQYGFLETYLHGNEITQIWHRQATGQVFVRSGNTTGWYGIASNAGAFTKIATQPGEWVLVDNASLSSDTNGTSFLNVVVPTALQGANVEYKLTIGAEFLASQFPSYPFLNCRKSNGNWDHGDKDFSYIRTAQVNNTAPNIYTATKVNPLAFEWVVTSNNCSCSAEVIVGRAGTSNYWNAIGRAGGYSDGGASSVSLAARTQWNTNISGFRIECSRTITLVKGSNMSLWARKTNEKHA